MYSLDSLKTGIIARVNNLEIAELKIGGSYQIYDQNNQIILNPKIQVLPNQSFLLDKLGYKHFLLKEIHEQPGIIREILNSYLNEEDQIYFPHLKKELLTEVKRITILGCGSAYYAGLVGKFIFEELSGLPTEICFSSEFTAREKVINQDTLVIAVSQSGETADTLLAVRQALEKNARLLALTNRAESTLAALAEENTLLIKAGIEVSVAATKSFTAQITCLYLLAIYLAEKQENNSTEKLKELKIKLKTVPHWLDQILGRGKDYRKTIIDYCHKKAFVFLGRGINYPIALEAALKLKEITYIQATGYASGEMKHGPIATIDQEVPTLSILTQKQNQHKVLHNAIEAKTRGAPSLGLLSDEDWVLASEFEKVLYVPSIHCDLLTPFVSVLPLQLIAYYLAEYLGKDVDQPRNLAKSVTVE